jgi:hypothetical protein
MIAAGCAVLGRFYDRLLCEMTSPAPESDSSARQSASDADDGGRLAAGRGELRLLAAPRLEDPGAAAGAVAVRSAGGLGAAPGPRALARRLRAAPPVQLELVCGRRGDGPGVVWASLPERSREQVLVLLARLIDAGALEQEA